MSAKGLPELFVDELKDIYNAEVQMTKSLPKMAKAAMSAGLKSAFEDHLQVTRAHVDRLEEVFGLLGVPVRGRTCEGMKGLKGVVLDAAIIASAQKVEHYEIATYGTPATFAQVLGPAEAEYLLGHALDEEKKADQPLT